MKQHIFLTGYMGSGKTTLGKATADLLQLPFIDLDKYIEAKEKKSIQEIFENEGEKSFREKEKMYLREIAEIKTLRIVALGGGTVCNDENLHLVKNKGILIYLELSANELTERLKTEKEKRPLLKNILENELPKFISDNLAQRKKQYEQAHIKINSLNLSASILVQAILDFTQKNSN